MERPWTGAAAFGAGTGAEFIPAHMPPPFFVPQKREKQPGTC
jgi:hypothetical protein